MTYTEAIDFLTEKVASKEIVFPKDEKGTQHPNFFKDMEDLYMILKKYQLGTC